MRLKPVIIKPRLTAFKRHALRRKQRLKSVPQSLKFMKTFKKLKYNTIALDWIHVCGTKGDQSLIGSV